MKASQVIRLGIFCFQLSLAILAPANAKAEKAAPIIAVASNMRDTIEKVGRLFFEDTGLKVRFSFGSSGNLVRQILQGAPFEMFMSADEGYVFRIADAGKSSDRGNIYAFGRLVAFAPEKSSLKDFSFPEDYSAAFGSQVKGRYAIANPELAPYGRAAKETLLHVGLWENMKPHLVYGENISQTAQFSLSGSAIGGIIAYSQALMPRFTNSGTYKLIPQRFHKPLGQRMVLLSGAGETTRQFYGYLGRNSAMNIIRDSGYTLETQEE